MLTDGKLLLLMEHSNSSTIEIESMESVTVWNVLLSLVGFCVNVAAEMYFLFALLPFGISAVTIWLATKNFLSVLPKQLPGCRNPQRLISLKEIEQVQKNYVSLMDLSDEINSVWSRLGMYMVLNMSTWMSTDLDMIWQSSEYVFSTFTVSITTYFAGAMVLSAESIKMVRKLMTK